MAKLVPVCPARATPTQLEFDIAHLQAKLGKMFGGLDQFDDAQQVFVGKLFVSQVSLRSACVRCSRLWAA